MLKRFEVSGTEYECGHQVGTAMRRAIRACLKELITDRVFSRHTKALRAVHAAILKKHPNLIEQLRGMADGAGVDYWRLLLLNAPEIRKMKHGCTDIMEVTSERTAITHNEDTGGAASYIRDCALVTFKLKGLTFTSFVYPGELPGNSYNWNSHGIFFSVNYLRPLNNQFSASRIPRYFTACALNEAKDIDDALRILRASHCASGFHYNLGQGTRLLSVEQWEDELSVQKINGQYVHTNHYIHPLFVKRAPAAQESIMRLKQARELLTKDASSLRALADRTNKTYPVCGTGARTGVTLSTVQFLPLEGRVTIYTPHTLKKEFSFKLHE